MLSIRGVQGCEIRCGQRGHAVCAGATQCAPVCVVLSSMRCPISVSMLDTGDAQGEAWCHRLIHTLGNSTSLVTCGYGSVRQRLIVWAPLAGWNTSCCIHTYTPAMQLTACATHLAFARLCCIQVAAVLQGCGQGLCSCAGECPAVVSCGRGYLSNHILCVALCCSLGGPMGVERPPPGFQPVRAPANNVVC